jgi:hypothetical protein
VRCADSACCLYNLTVDIIIIERTWIYVLCRHIKGGEESKLKNFQRTLSTIEVDTLNYLHDAYNCKTGEIEKRISIKEGKI